MEAVGLAVGSVGLITILNESIASIKALEIFGQVGSGHSEVETLRKTLRSLAEFSSIIGDADLAESLLHNLARASAQLEAATKKSSRSKFQHLLRASKRRELANTLKSLEKTLSLLHWKITFQISNDLQRNFKLLDVKTEEAQQAKTDLANIKRRLSSSLSNNDKLIQLFGVAKAFDIRQHELVRVRYEDTGKWVLSSKEFISWKDGEYFNSQVLWISGQPGSGKSVLMSTIIDWALEQASESEKDVVVYFYFEASRKDTTRDALSSLLRQLLSKDIKLPTSITSFLEVCGRPSAELETGSSPFNLNKVISAFLTLSREFKTVTVCMDGLDECNDVDNLLRLLERISESSCRLTVASRPWVEFTRFFEGQLTIEITERNDIDIRQYFRTFLRENPRLTSMMEDNLSKEAEDLIEKRSHGSFVWSGLQMEQLLLLTCRSEIKEYLNSSPAGPEDMYRLLLSRIKEQHPSQVDLASKVVTWLTASNRLLTLSELRQAVSINTNPGDPQFVLDPDRVPPIWIIEEVCKGLITIEESQDIIKLAHHSLGNLFYQNRHLEGLLEIHQTDYMAACCIAYIKTPELGLGPRENIGAYQQRLSSMPLLLYVAENWGFHIEQDSDANTKLEDILGVLKNKQYLNSLVQLIHVGGRPGNDQDVKYFPTDFTVMHMAAYFDIDFTLENKPLLSNFPEDIDNKDSWGRTALHIAAGRGHGSICELLLQSRAKINIRDNSNKSPLHHAVSGGHHVVLEMMLNAGPLHILEKEGQELLEAATHSGHLDTVYLLLTRGIAKVAEETVHSAAAQGDFDIVELLINHSDFKGLNGAMLEAARQGFAQAALRLFEMGADVTAADSGERMTPLHHAVVHDQVPLITWLLSIGADPEAKNAKGQTPLFIGAELGHSRVVQALLEAGAFMYANDTRGRTPLDVAVAAGDADTVRILCSYGCTLRKSVPASDLKETAQAGEAELNALQAASFGGFDEIVSIPREDVLNLDTRGRTSRAPLSYAAAAGLERIVRRPLDNVVDANAQDSSGRTPLSYAAENGHDSVANALLERDVEPSLHSSPSETDSDWSTSPSTLTSASYPATPYQAKSHYPCEQCPAAFDRISLLAEHYKSCHSSSPPDISAQYSCGRCGPSFRRRIDFIRHLRSQAHFNEYHQCRCGRTFQRDSGFKSHVEKSECQGPNSYACRCGHSVQSYAEALTLVSNGGHIYRCDGRRPQGRPTKKKDEQNLAVSN